MATWREKFAEMAKTISRASTEFVQTSKINVELSGEKTKRKDIYVEMGKKVKEIYESGESLGAFFDGKYEELVAVEQRIKDLRVQIDEVKGLRSCPSCGKSNVRELDYCAKCGCAMYSTAGHVPQPNTRPAEDTYDPHTQSAKVCIICGVKVAEDDTVCPGCGREL